MTFSFKDLSEKVFIPFELNDESAKLPVYDIDPDTHYCNKLCEQYNNGCNDLVEDTFNDMCNKLPKKDKGFSLYQS